MKQRAKKRSKMRGLSQLLLLLDKNEPQVVVDGSGKIVDRIAMHLVK